MTTDNEPTKEPRQLVGHRMRVGALLVAVIAALGIGTAVAASADDPDEVPAMDHAFFGEHGDDPGRGELREDVKKLHGLEGEERRDAMRQLREDARDGKYGERVEGRFERHAAHRDAFFALLPDELQADLKQIREADPEDRKALHEDIRKKSLAGDYGEKVKEAFTIMGEHRAKPGEPDHS